MDHHKNLAGIVFTCSTAVKKVSELFFKEHVLCYVLSGKIEMFNGLTHRVFQAGDLFLNKRNTLGKFLKYPVDGVPYKSISFVLDKQFLVGHHQANNHKFEYGQVTDESILPIPVDVLLANFLQSLMPWFDEKIPEALIDLKKQEAVLLMLKSSPSLKAVLFDYNDPGKIDLQAFMHQHFKFHVDIPQLAYLTGRSHATFKRDFEKIFRMTPHRWIQAKRLQEAYYLLAEQHKKPNAIYAEVGFETLAHFSFAFKKYFGQNPSTISKQFEQSAH